MDKRRCSATNRAGNPCGRRPAPGANVCSAHGAKAPQVQRKAAERVAEREAIAMFDRYAPDRSQPVSDPLNALLALAGEVTAFKDFVAGRVAEMRADTWRYEGEHAEQVRAEISLYERALDRTARVLADINRLGLEERQVKLAERQGQLVAQVIRRVLDELELTAEQERRVPVVVPRALRLVGGAA